MYTHPVYVYNNSFVNKMVNCIIWIKKFVHENEVLGIIHFILWEKYIPVGACVLHSHVVNEIENSK